MTSSIDAWDESMAANVRSLFILAKLVVPHMAAEGGGSIVNISSGGADHAATAAMPPGFLAYSVAKAAMERFTTALAPEIAARGVVVNALRPGAVKTELATRELGEGFDWTGWTEPGGRGAGRGLPGGADRYRIHGAHRRRVGLRIDVAVRIGAPEPAGVLRPCFPAPIAARQGRSV